MAQIGGMEWVWLLLVVFSGGTKIGTFCSIKEEICRGQLDSVRYLRFKWQYKKKNNIFERCNLLWKS